MPATHTQHDDDHDHDQGLAHDLQTLLSRQPDRRSALRWLALGTLAPASAFSLVGCGGGGDDSSTATTTTGTTTTGTTTTTTTTTSSGTCSVIPEETAGPYPGDGSNSTSAGVANALLLTGIVRSDITTSIGSGDTATGVPLTITLKLLNTSASCATLAGYAIYLWHCTADGEYSMYSSDIADQNYLRGVQETDANGEATFTTIFPGCYSGRMPHMHFEVYPSLALATTAANKVKTSQLSFPVATCSEVYASSGYEASVSNLARISFASDNVFSDGTSLQIATISGSVSAGYTASLDVAIAA